jgi:hypothetical protein
MKTYQLNVPTLVDSISENNKKDLENCQPGQEVEKICFHGSMSVLGKQPSVLLATKSGTIFKLNTDRIGGENDLDLDAPIIYQPPFVELEFQNPAILDEDSKLAKNLLVRGRKDCRGNRVEREIMHFHQSKILFLEVLAINSDVILSIDVEGKLALWKYSLEFFGGQCRFVPEITADIKKSITNYTSIGDKQLIDPPPIDIVSQLELWRTNTEIHSSDENENSTTTTTTTNFLTEKFQPFYDRYSGTWYSYEKVTVSINKYSSPSEENDSEKNKKAKVSDSDEDKDKDVEDDMSDVKKIVKNKLINEIKVTSTVQWGLQTVEETREEMEVSLVRISPDGEDVILLLKALKITGHYKLLCFNTTLLECLPPYVEFNLGEREYVQEVIVGPVLGESLSRFVFVYTTHAQMRVFSMDSGIEMVDATFFAKSPRHGCNLCGATSISLCGMQRVFAACKPGACSVTIGVFKDNGSIPAKDREPIINPIEPGAFVALRRPFEDQKRLAISSYIFGVQDVEASDEDEDEDEDIDTQQHESELVVCEILDEIMSYVWKEYENESIGLNRHDLLVQVYNEPPFGFLEPNEWP